jgi:hypothetical protein
LRASSGGMQRQEENTKDEKSRWHADLLGENLRGEG